MGSWIGHVDEAVFFLMLGVWWMAHFFPAHIRSTRGGASYSTQLSYGLPCKPGIPIEAILKTLFPFCGLLGEVFNCGLALLDEQGNFRKLAQMHHMTLYIIFMIHGFTDLLSYSGAVLPRGIAYLSAAVSFIWYGQAFQLHAHMPGKPEMETIIHTLPTWVMYVMAAAILVELWKPNCFSAQVVRVWSILVLGTWFFHVAFILYKPLPLPGADSNPNWDQKDERNTHAMVAYFGFHLIFNIVLVTAFYLGSLVCLRLRGEKTYKFEPLNSEV